MNRSCSNTLRGRVRLRASALGSSMVLLVFAGPAGAQDAGVEPTLDLLSAIDRALAVDPGRALRQAETERLLGPLSEAKAGYRPALGFSVSGIRFEEPMPVAPIHGLDPSAAPTFDRGLVQSRWSLGYTLFDGGTRAAAVSKASALVESSARRIDLSEMESIEGVTRSFILVQTRREILEAHRSRVAALEAERDRVRRLIEAGSAPEVEGLRAEAALAGALADREASRISVQLSEMDLARWLGLPADSVRGRPLESIDEAVPASGAVTRTPSSDHPLLESARLGTEAAADERRLASSAWWPSVSTEGAFNHFGSFDGDHTGEWQIGVRASYALYTGGARSGRIAAADAGVRVAQENERLVRREVDRAVEQAWAAWERERVRSSSLEVSVSRYEEVVRVEALALSEGVGVQTDFLAAQSSLVQARAALAEARYGMISARVALAFARGVLSRTWIVEFLNSERPEDL